MIPSEIRVGVDGSPSSLAALHWAAAEAAGRGAELVVVHAYDWRVVGARVQVGGAYAEAEREWAQTLVDEAVAQVHATAPEVRVRGEVALGAPGPILSHPTGSVALTVVGSRGRGGFASLLLGSVSQQVATHADGSVVVVRGRTGIKDGPIVVGVDGSPGSERALREALDTAVARRTGVLAARVYSSIGPSMATDIAPYVEDPVQRREHEMLFLTEDIAAWRDKYPDVVIEPVVLEGHTAGVLADLSASAQLVVVGMRGHGDFSGLMLGSVGRQLLHHAECPVLIAREHSVTDR
jgi:nucleotide-binding universal stress UspA family protein